MDQIRPLLWEMRTARGWSLGELARRAGVSKAALSRWESGTRSPRVAELDAVLDALGAGAAQRALAFARIEAPRALRRLRSQDATAGLGAPPTAGDLLHAMRQRRGYTQDQVAAQVGVGQSTVARWERGERLPSSEHVQALCFALDAREEELFTLTTGGFQEGDVAEHRSWDEREACLTDRLLWHHYGRPEEDGGGSELEYIVLELRAWRLAAQDPRARTLLARILAYHADAMRNQERWSEAATLARRSLDLIPREDVPPRFAFRVAAVAAAAAVYGGTRDAPERGLQILERWLERSPSPEYRAWLLSDFAEYLAMDQHVDEARSLAEHACRVAQYCGYPLELALRRVDQERVLLKAGRPAEALRVAPELPPTTVPYWPKSYPYVRRALTLAEANEQVGNLDAAFEWVRTASTVIETCGHERLRVRAVMLARRLR